MGLLVTPAQPVEANTVGGCEALTQQSTVACTQRTECVRVNVEQNLSACLTVTMEASRVVTANGLRAFTCSSTLSYQVRVGTIIRYVDLPPPHANVTVQCFVPPDGIPSGGAGVGAAVATPGFVAADKPALCAVGTVVWPGGIIEASQRVRDVCLTF
jgi:hypothetical protein